EAEPDEDASHGTEHSHGSPRFLLVGLLAFGRRFLLLEQDLALEDVVELLAELPGIGRAHHRRAERSQRLEPVRVDVEGDEVCRERLSTPARRVLEPRQLAGRLRTGGVDAVGQHEDVLVREPRGGDGLRHAPRGVVDDRERDALLGRRRGPFVATGNRGEDDDEGDEKAEKRSPAGASPSHTSSVLPALYGDPELLMAGEAYISEPC